MGAVQTVQSISNWSCWKSSSQAISKSPHMFLQMLLESAPSCPLPIQIFIISQLCYYRSFLVSTSLLFSQPIIHTASRVNFQSASMITDLCKTSAGSSPVSGYRTKSKYHSMKSELTYPSTDTAFSHLTHRTSATIPIPQLLKVLCGFMWFWDLASSESIFVLILHFSAWGVHFTWKMFLPPPCCPSATWPPPGPLDCTMISQRPRFLLPSFEGSGT